MLKKNSLLVHAEIEINNKYIFFPSENLPKHAKLCRDPYQKEKNEYIGILCNYFKFFFSPFHELPYFEMSKWQCIKIGFEFKKNKTGTFGIYPKWWNYYKLSVYMLEL